jgi:esterase/lipase superfamily enzyme
MVKEIHQWFSPALQKEMPVSIYGHYGFALLMIPTAAADFLEYERFELIDHLTPMIDAGKIKVFSINSINMESWMNKGMEINSMNTYLMKWFLSFIRIHLEKRPSLLQARHLAPCTR